jgi:hypothetical protein
MTADRATFWEGVVAGVLWVAVAVFAALSVTLGIIISA